MHLPYHQLRRVHLATSPVIGTFVYSPTLRAWEPFAAAVQFGVFPLIALAGLALWLGPRLGRRSSATA
jgi:hypothetical protein